MSYFLSDEHGFVRDFGSGAQLERFTLWGNRQESAIRAFVQQGFSTMPLLLMPALARSRAVDATVERMRKELIETCKEVVGSLSIQDGTSDDTQLRSAVGNGSNQYVQKGSGTKSGHAGKRGDSTRSALNKLAKLPAEGYGFSHVPFEQASDKNARALEDREIPKDMVSKDYDPSTEHPLATQDAVETDKVADIIMKGAGTSPDYQDQNGQTNAPPIVANYRGRDYIIDGHHRMTAALLQRKSIKVRYYRVRK